MFESEATIFFRLAFALVKFVVQDVEEQRLDQLQNVGAGSEMHTARAARIFIPIIDSARNKEIQSPKLDGQTSEFDDLRGVVNRKFKPDVLGRIFKAERGEQLVPKHLRVGFFRAVSAPRVDEFFQSRLAFNDIMPFNLRNSDQCRVLPLPIETARNIHDAPSSSE